MIAWHDNEAPSDEESSIAWDAATNFPMRSFRANVLVIGLIAAGPTIIFIAATLDLPWTAAPVLLAATVLPVAYATILNYFTAELLMRPVVEDIAAALPEDFPFSANGLLIRKRLKLVLPVFTSFVGLIVAALLTGDGGTDALALSLVAAVGVGLVLSWELTVLLSRSVTSPIGALRAGLTRVRAGDYEARVPVVTSDELGELSHSFNLMAAGLSERERMREAFGTYLDRDIAPLILSGNLPPEGVEVTVSIMFVDVRGFTAFAERSDAAEVVAALNALFEVMVPIVSRHGGHVDKFIGDGLLAVFGAPEGYPDHADRAVAAGLEIVGAINTAGSRAARRRRRQHGPRRRRVDRRRRAAELQRDRRRRQRLGTRRVGDARDRRRPADHGRHARRADAAAPAGVARHGAAEGQGRARRGAGLRRGGGRAALRAARAEPAPQARG